MHSNTPTDISPAADTDAITGAGNDRGGPTGNRPEKSPSEKSLSGKSLKSRENDLPITIPASVPGPLHNMLVADVAKRDGESASPDMAVAEVAKLLDGLSCETLTVVHDGYLLGTISCRDIVGRCVARAKDPRAVTVRQCMTLDAPYCYESDGLADARERLRDEGIEVMLVLSGEGKFAGTIRRQDLEDYNEAGPAMIWSLPGEEPAPFPHR